MCRHVVCVRAFTHVCVCVSHRCGTAEGLDAGRHCLNKWGFRRVEDIVWIKTNKERNPRTGYLQAINQEPYSILVHTKV